MKNAITIMLTAILLLPVTQTIAANAPTRPECIAPASPGGGFDLTCKLIQATLQETKVLDKPMRVTFMPGGVGAVAYNAIVAQRPAEGGTLIAFSSGSLLNLSQGKFGRYNENDVRWLATVGADYGMIAVRADSPYQTLKDLVDALQRDASAVAFGAGASIGSQDWMKVALLAREAGIDPRNMRYVAFEGGGEPITALLGSHIQAISGDMSEMVPYLAGDQLRILAVYADERLPGEMAGVPTAKEQGYNLLWPIIRGFYVGPKVSDAEYQWWVTAFEQAMESDVFQQQREQRGLFEFKLSGSELDTYIKTQVAEYRDLAKSFGLAE